MKGFIYHIEFAKTGLSLSGGEKSMIELVKFLSKKKIKNIILTTDNGKQVYENCGLQSSEYIIYKTIDSYSTEKHHIFISYVMRLQLIRKIIKNLTIYKEDVIICHSDFFPNSLTSYRIAKKNNLGNFILFYYHLMVLHLSQGFEGEYTKKYNFPNLALIHHFLNQLLYNYIIKCLQNSIIVTVNSFYKTRLTKIFGEKVYLLDPFGGSDEEIILNTKEDKNKYDIVWLGRFQQLKGILEVPQIIAGIAKKISTIKVAIIGGGNEDIRIALEKEIQELGLQENIDLLGPLFGSEKEKILSNSKIFLQNSYFESYGLVNLEAMQHQLAIVAYDLPTYSAFREGLLVSPLGDRNKIGECIVNLLQNNELYKKQKMLSTLTGEKFSREKTGEQILGLITKNSGN